MERLSGTSDTHPRCAGNLSSVAGGFDANPLRALVLIVQKPEAYDEFGAAAYQSMTAKRNEGTTPTSAGYRSL